MDKIYKQPATSAIGSTSSQSHRDRTKRQPGAASYTGDRICKQPATLGIASTCSQLHWVQDLQAASYTGDRIYRQPVTLGQSVFMWTPFVKLRGTWFGFEKGFDIKIIFVANLGDVQFRRATHNKSGVRPTPVL